MITIATLPTAVILLLKTPNVNINTLCIMDKYSNDIILNFLLCQVYLS